VQLVIAGKSHPADDGGKQLIQEMVRFADARTCGTASCSCPTTTSAWRRPLYPGCDVWLNNPLRPLEACGTSGMKAALNGGLNLSILDGWWDEWYDGENGWAIPTADGVDDPDRRDDLEAAALYDLVEKSGRAALLRPRRGGLPHRWIEMVRHTLRRSGRRCSPAGWSATTSAALRAGGAAEGGAPARQGWTARSSRTVRPGRATALPPAGCT
jgi:glycogen phosphorylase